MLDKLSKAKLSNHLQGLYSEMFPEILQQFCWLMTIPLLEPVNALLSQTFENYDLNYEIMNYDALCIMICVRNMLLVVARALICGC